MSQLPEGWIQDKLGNISRRITKGSTPTSYGFKYQDRGIAFVKVENIKNGIIDSSSIKHFISLEANLNQARLILESGDILFSIAGTIGTTCLVREQDLPANTNQALAIIRGTGIAVIPKFLRYQLESQVTRKQAEQQQRGGGMLNLSLADVSNFDILIPPLAEQRRIAATLEPLLGSVATYQQRLAKIPVVLKRFRQAVLAAVLVEQSESVSIRDVLAAPLSNGRSVVTASNGFPVLRLTCLKNGLIDLSERKIGAWTRQEARNFLVAQGDYLVARGNGSLSLVGRGGLVDQISNEVAYPDTLIRIRVNEALVNTKYFGLIWNSSIIRSQIESAARTSAGIWKISQRDIENFVMPIPPLAKQYEIVRHVEGLFKLVDQIEARYHRAKPMVDKLQQSILAKAFRGELVPTEAELARREGRDYEPTSVLLERIRSERAEHAQGRKGKAGSQPKPTRTGKRDGSCISLETD